MTVKEPSVDVAVRERLLAASLDLFTAKGYSATSVREIVAAAGVTKPVLYYYFGSKEGIYLALMEETYQQFQNILAQLSASSGTAAEKVMLMATHLFQAFVDKLDVVRLIYSIYFGPPQGAPQFPHDQYFDLMVREIATLVKEGMDRGELRRVEVETATWLIVSCMNTAMEEQLCHISPRLDLDRLRSMLTLVLDAISPGGTE